MRRAGFGGGRWSVAANGTVIEQAQLLTTHNLAGLVVRIGIRADWAALCRGGARRGHRRPAAPDVAVDLPGPEAAATVTP